MKIEKIIYKNHPFFKHGFEIDFKKGENIPFITYLVGNNGSGKTNILDSIYRCVGNTYEPGIIKNMAFEADYYLRVNDREKDLNNLHCNSFIYNISVNGVGGFSSHYRDMNNNPIIINQLTEIRKIIYSTAEVKFLDSNIESVKANNVDELNIDVSKDLSKTIPQLLVDIRTIDNEERSEWLRNNRKKTRDDCPNEIGGRMERFIKGFSLIYGYSKVFSCIGNEGGKKVILFKNADGTNVDIGKFSSGEQQILYRVGHILKNLNLISGGIILIDEPELSLHPIRQERFRIMLMEIFKNLDVQIIIATHSPYIFRKIDNNIEQVIKIDAYLGINEKLDTNTLFNEKSLSSSYINYIAYDIIDYQLHIELYDALLRKFLGDESDSPGRLDDILIRDRNEPIEVTFTKTGSTIEKRETIMTRIRNKMHHPSEKNRPVFSEQKMKESIDRMIYLLKF